MTGEVVMGLLIPFARKPFESSHNFPTARGFAIAREIIRKKGGFVL